MQCGLLGKKLVHSYSPQIHSYLGNYAYDLFEKEPNELEFFLKNGDFTGLNVTIPYKKDVLPYCDELSNRAAMLGAVNTIVRRKDGRLVGHNSDYFGFQYLMRKSGLNVSGKKVLVLGSGGASVTAVSVLQQQGANTIVISRNGVNNYDNLERHRDASVIVNTTPVGMYPHVGFSPIDLAIFPSLQGVLDIVYNPARTQLLLDAENRGLVALNGLWMLVGQAKESAEWFLDTKIDDNVIERIYNILRRQMENIVLIGMPGSGKSTVGQQLAQELNRIFVDADVELVRKAGMQIPDIFERSGEAGFRKLETQILSQIGKESGLVIATGGGCVAKQENYPLLHQNGQIFWLQRDLRSLPVDGRPLSIRNRLEDMYIIRKPLYEYFSDYVIDNNGSINEAVSQILSKEGYR